MLIPLIWLIGTLTSMLLLIRWISRHIQGIGLLLGGNRDIAIIIYFLVMLPGILLHEVSHWVMAHLLGLRTGKVSIGPRKGSGGKVQLGSVQIARSDPFRESMVGLAPLLAGSGLVLLIGAVVFDLRTLSQAFVIGDVGWFLELMVSFVKVPDFWLWLYLIFAISNAMLPSESDRRAWLPLAIFLAIIAAVMAIVGWTPQMPASVVDRVVGAVQYLDTAFLITLVIDLIFAGFIFGFERLLNFLTGNQVAY
jgi:hypothetical protein